MNTGFECLEYNEGSSSLYYFSTMYERDCRYAVGYYFSDECEQLVGPYDSPEEARKAMKAYEP